MSEQKIWTIDRNIQELDEQITPMEEKQREIYKTGRELMLGIANTHMNERLWSTLPKMQKRLGELQRKYRLLDHFAWEKRDTYERKDLEKRKKAASNDIYWFKKEAKIPVIRELLQSSKIDRYGTVDEPATMLMKMAMAYALDLNNLVRFSCKGDFDHYKTPSDCGSCNEAEENVRLIGIQDYFQAQGHRVYGVDEDKIQHGILNTVWKIRNESKRDTLYEQAKAYDAIERPSEEHLAELKEKKQTLECYKMEEVDKIAGAVKDLTSKLKDALK